MRLDCPSQARFLPRLRRKRSPASSGISRSLIRRPTRSSSARMSTSSTHVLEKLRPSCNLPRALVFPWTTSYAVELNARRAAIIAEHYPEVRLLGPCSFEATRITRHSFSLVYLNPPFDDEFGGGGREETSFLRQAVDLLVPGGILVLVCPVSQVYGKSRMCELLDTWFDQLELFLFPDHCRKYNECVVFGRRRKTALTDELIFEEGILTNRGIRRCSAAPIAKLARLGEPQFLRWRYAEPDIASRKSELDTWELPFSVAPKRFEKTALTEEELERELARSPLHDALRQRTLSPLKRPPLSLNKGHTSLLLMTGMLDGYVPSIRPMSCEA